VTIPTPGTESNAHAAAEEMVDLIDTRNRVIGWARRREIRGRNLLHRGVGIICRNSRNEIYLHRRTTTKDVFPGLYDMFVGGVVASGETFGDAALREIGEELGISGPVPRWLFDHLYIGPHNRSLVAVFEVLWDGDIVHQESEVAWGAFVGEIELEQLIATLGFVPDGLEIYEILRRGRAAGASKSTSRSDHDRR
jgi:8-oxo-dGTP pyrophosphatase MutT (NUDIX family)